MVQRSVVETENRKVFKHQKLKYRLHIPLSSYMHPYFADKGVPIPFV
jgi:hypothetical protein